MSFSKTNLYNITLKNLGIGVTVQSTTESNIYNSTLNTYYEVAKEQALKDFDWNFARTYRELTLTVNDCENPRYQYEYDYPNDCLEARELVDVSPDVRTAFEPASSSITKSLVINTNVNPAKLRYTRRIDNESEFTAEFLMAFSWYLAFLAAPSIASDAENKRNTAFKIYSGMVGKAQVSNANEGYDDFEKEAPWVEGS